MSPYSLPSMLIVGKNSGIKRITNDFRFLNNRFWGLNLAFPLISDAFAILGSSKFECLLVLD